MAYNNFYSSYRTPHEEEELKKKEEKLISKLNEVGSVTCDQCKKKLVRVFAPRSGLQPVFKDDVQDYLRRMRNAMSAYNKRGAKSECHISGPEYTIVYNSNHFSKPYADNLGRGNTHGYCGRSVYLGYSAINVVSRLFLGQRMIRQACISNGVKPQEIRDWMETQKPSILGDLFGYGFEFQEIKGTDLWAGLYGYGQLHANTVAYDVAKVGGIEWATEMDLIISNAPPSQGSGGKYEMSPTHGCVEYSTINYKADLAVDLPLGVNFDSLDRSNWDKVINVKTATGVDAKVKVSHDGISAASINTMTHQLHKHGVPRNFWVIQPEAYKGSVKIHPGDIVL